MQIYRKSARHLFAFKVHFMSFETYYVGVSVRLVMSCGVFLQHSGDWRCWLPHVGPVWLGECFLCVRPPLSPVGLLHVEVSAQRRRQASLL